MATKPLSTEAIALTEKKMDMSLDEIIQMSKKKIYSGKKPPRISNKSRGFSKPNASLRNSNVQRFMDSKMFVRQGALAQKRTNFSSNQFALTEGIARKAQMAPNRSGVNNWRNQRVAASTSIQVHPPDKPNAMENATKPVPHTLDALFANMKQQRMRAANQQSRRGGGGATSSNPSKWARQNPRGRGSGFRGRGTHQSKP